MTRFIVVTFAFLAWAFYELSGGAEFEPRSVTQSDMPSDPLKSENQAEPEVDVTRVSLDLTSVEDVVSGTQQAGPLAPSVLATQPAMQDAVASNGTIVLPSLVRNSASDENALATLDKVITLFEPPQDKDFRRVTGTRVNVRTGPGTEHGVLYQVVQGDQVEVLEDDASGWVRIRLPDRSGDGWMAEFLLTER